MEEKRRSKTSLSLPLCVFVSPCLSVCHLIPFHSPPAHSECYKEHLCLISRSRGRVKIHGMPTVKLTEKVLEIKGILAWYELFFCTHNVLIYHYSSPL